MSIYPNRARLLDVIQDAGLKRSGLVASCIFPEVQVPSEQFEWIDWEEEYEDLKPIDDSIGCTSQPHRIDASPFVYKQGKTKEHALDIVLKNCNVSACTPTGELPFNIDAKKTQQLVDKLLLNREIAAVAKATNEASYTAGSAPLTEDSDGKLFTLARATIFAPGYDLLGLFQAFQHNAEYGERNTLVLDLATWYAMLRHPTFKMGGCAIPPMAAKEEVAGLIGVSKICIADASYNTAAPGSAVSLNKFWGNYILMTRSFGMVTPDEATRGFGFSAYTKDLTQRIYFDDKVGSDGSNIQVVSHDFTEIVADIKAATLLKLT